MRKPAVLASLLLICVLGFYAGSSVLPGILGRGADLPAVKQGDTGGEVGLGGEVKTEEAPPVEETPPVEESKPEGPPDPPGGKDRYWIDVDVTAQLVTIYEGETVLKTITCSTGIEGNETPLGTFEIQNRGDWFFTEKYGQGAKYWVSFKDWGIYLFHSLAMDRDKNIIPEESEKLGQPASHGCVRLPVEEAKWIYETIPAHSKVVIHE